MDSSLRIFRRMLQLWLFGSDLKVVQGDCGGGGCTYLFMFPSDIFTCPSIKMTFCKKKQASAMQTEAKVFGKIPLKTEKCKAIILLVE